MDIFKEDLLKNKYFLILVTILVIAGGVIWFLNYNSVESRCRRYVKGLGSVFGEERNKLRELQLEKASDSLIRECIRRGGP